MTFSFILYPTIVNTLFSLTFDIVKKIKKFQNGKTILVLSTFLRHSPEVEAHAISLFVELTRQTPKYFKVSKISMKILSKIAAGQFSILAPQKDDGSNYPRVSSLSLDLLFSFRYPVKIFCM